MDDLISRQAAIEAICEECHMETDYHRCEGYKKDSRWCEYSTALNDLPSAQPEPLSKAYAKAVFTWLLDYQIKSVELKGRYEPYEVLSWVANDWRREHE